MDAFRQGLFGLCRAAGIGIFNGTVFGLQGAKCMLPSASGLGEQFAVQGQSINFFQGTPLLSNAGISLPSALR